MEPDDRYYDLACVALSSVGRSDCVLIDDRVAVVLAKRFHPGESRGTSLRWRDLDGDHEQRFPPGTVVDALVVVTPEGRHFLTEDADLLRLREATLFDAEFEREKLHALQAVVACACSSCVHRSAGPASAQWSCPECRDGSCAGVHSYAPAELRSDGTARPVARADDDVFALLREHVEADDRWETERTEEARVAMRATWRTRLGRLDRPLDRLERAEWPENLRTDRCQPVVLQRDDEGPDEQRSFARAGCLGCGWVGSVVEDGPDRYAWNEAAEAAHDHAWPGWRDLPPLYEPPAVSEGQATAVARFLDRARRLYPPGWIEAGGPILTWRTPGETRHHDGAPNGGWDLGCVDPRVPLCPSCDKPEWLEGTYRGREKPLPPTICGTCTTREERIAARLDRLDEPAAERPDLEPPGL